MPTATIAPSIPFSAPLLGTLSVGARFVPAASLSEMYSQPLVSALDNFCSSLNTFSIGDSKKGKISLKQSLKGDVLLSRVAALCGDMGPRKAAPHRGISFRRQKSEVLTFPPEIKGGA